MNAIRRLPWRGMALGVLWSAVIIGLWGLHPFWAGAAFSALAVAGWHRAHRGRPYFVMVGNKFVGSEDGGFSVVVGKPPVFKGCRTKDSTPARALSA